MDQHITILANPAWLHHIMHSRQYNSEETTRKRSTPAAETLSLRLGSHSKVLLWFDACKVVTGSFHRFRRKSTYCSSRRTVVSSQKILRGSSIALVTIYKQSTNRKPPAELITLAAGFSVCLCIFGNARKINDFSVLLPPFVGMLQNLVS